MSFTATLDLGGQKYELQECRCGFKQKRDILGRPESGVSGGIIRLLLEVNEDDTFATWIANPKKKENGKITLYRIDQESKFKQIEFEGAYLVNLVESFVSDGELNMLEWEGTEFADEDMKGTFEFIMDHQLRTRKSYIIYCRISAEKLKIDGVEHDNRWLEST